MKIFAEIFKIFWYKMFCRLTMHFCFGFFRNLKIFVGGFESFDFRCWLTKKFSEDFHFDAWAIFTLFIFLAKLLWKLVIKTIFVIFFSVFQSVSVLWRQQICCFYIDEAINQIFIIYFEKYLRILIQFSLATLKNSKANKFTFEINFFSNV